MAKEKFSTQTPVVRDISAKKRKLHTHITECKSAKRIEFYDAIHQCDDETIAKLTNVFSILLKRKLC